MLRQTFSDFEFLVLDDGSRSEPTRSCLARRAAGGRAHPRSARSLTGGADSDRSNLGLKRARGELIARQDADDWSEPERLERQIVFLRAHPEIALCGCDAWRHQQNGTLLWRTRLPETDA